MGRVALGSASVPALAAVAWLVAGHAPRLRVIELPTGVVEIHAELLVEGPALVQGAATGTVLRAAADFHGRALVVVRGGEVALSGFSIDGNRAAIETRAVRAGLPPSDRTFAQFTAANGILAEDCGHLTVEGLRIGNVAGFAVLVSRSRDVSIDGLEVSDSGSLNPQGRNNTTGGILLEEGTAGFRVTHCRFRNILGNGVWTHSLYTSPRNADGLIAWNSFLTIGRDALQVGHATNVLVEENAGRRIGYPEDAVEDVPVAIDTAGNVDRSRYARNRFEDINGKCIDLDGFHDGAVEDNFCRDMTNFGIVFNDSNPDMQSRNVRVTENRIDGARYGGIFVIGEGHLIAHNRLTNLNTARCGPCYYLPDEPDLLRSGIYLAKGVSRSTPARGDRIEDNFITGYGMDRRCVMRAPGIAAEWNVVRGNQCRNLTPAIPLR
ncbi:MAG: right-handed parallel beta-helix repeat-containing protein [Bryobacteraceae bacterium]